MTAKPSPSDVALTGWPRELLLPTVQAYRRAMGEGYRDGPARELATRAYLAAGGNPDQASRQVGEMVASVSAQHGAWFWGPAERWVAEGEAWWRARGIWPPPKDPSAWPEHLRPKDRLPG